jgi:hypothetical protein
MPTRHAQTGWVDPGALLSFLRECPGAERRTSTLPAGFTNRSGNRLLVGIGAARLPVVIINRHLFLARMPGRNGLGLRRIETIADVIVDEFIIVVILPVLMILFE